MGFTQVEVIEWERATSADENVDSTKYQSSSPDLSYIGQSVLDDEKAFRAKQEELKARRLRRNQLEKVAQAGRASAQYELALLYSKGVDARASDQRNSFNWYLRAATQGHENAQVNVGLMYARGHGVIPNRGLAYFWWMLASARGNAAAKKNCELIRSKLSPNELAKAQSAAGKWSEVHE